jgi:hypothetical protein
MAVPISVSFPALLKRRHADVQVLSVWSAAVLERTNSGLAGPKLIIEVVYFLR